MNIIYGDGQAKHETHKYKDSFDPKDEWHIYEMAWTPDYVSWSIDNSEVRRVKTEDPSIKYLNKGQSVMMNFWTPTFDSWGKGFDAADMPWEVKYDYVETFTYNTQTNGFDFHWRDDFVTFDSERWHKSDNTTFDANSTTFRASQSFIEDGHLVLKMEPDSHERLHAGEHYRPTTVIPVETEPAYEHIGAKGEKTKKEDKHFDVLQEQHESHVEHEQHPHAERRQYEHDLGYGASEYYGPQHERDLRAFYNRRAYPQYSDYPRDMEARHYDEHHGEEEHHAEMGQETPGAHLDAHRIPVEHAPHGEFHEEGHGHLGSETGPHDATPIHSASTEPHHASAFPGYYGDMFAQTNSEEMYETEEDQHREGYAPIDDEFSTLTDHQFDHE